MKHLFYIYDGLITVLRGIFNRYTLKVAAFLLFVAYYISVILAAFFAICNTIILSGYVSHVFYKGLRCGPWGTVWLYLYVIVNILYAVGYTRSNKQKRRQRWSREAL